jgi:RNA polymerase sigma-70 factor (ECF subfamily)
MRLEQEYSERGKGPAFQALRSSLDGQGDAKSHAQIASQLGISEGAARVMGHRMRRRYREPLRDEIAQTVADAGLVDEEIQYLLQCL